MGRRIVTERMRDRVPDLLRAVRAGAPPNEGIGRRINIV